MPMTQKIHSITKKELISFCVYFPNFAGTAMKPKTQEGLASTL